MTLLDRAGCETRLKAIFAADIVDDRVVAGPLAAAAAFVCLFVGAIDGQSPIRPTAVLWMSDEAASNTSEEFRQAWAAAAVKGRGNLDQMLRQHDVDPNARWYRENSRETLRDEVFRGWTTYGAISRDPALATTSSRPAWTLSREFADLFSPELTGNALENAIKMWQSRHLDKTALARQAVMGRLERADVSVTVRLPGGTSRQLRPGESSLLLKGVIEDLAPRLLQKPHVASISESATPLSPDDEEHLRQLGIPLNARALLPDAILADVGPAPMELWFVEAVATDGEIHSPRKEQLQQLAVDAGHAPENVRYLTAFLSRADAAWRRRTSRIAPGTLVWFLSEPDVIVRLDQLPRGDSGGRAGGSL